MSDMEAAYGAMEQMEIESIAGEEYTTLSGGQQQLVLIARALAQEPKILIMDEPTASLDFGNQQFVLGRMQALSRHGMAVVMVTHDPHHALLCANKVIVMDDDVIVKEGSPDETITTEMLERIYGAQVHVATVKLDSSDEVKSVIPLLRRDNAGKDAPRAAHAGVEQPTKIRPRGRDPHGRSYPPPPRMKK
jgi:ABC-type cobalamin/Fe3+-siderophores transport system ATPase subunit